MINYQISNYYLCYTAFMAVNLSASEDVKEDTDKLFELEI
jgi:hypothetical protein